MCESILTVKHAAGFKRLNNIVHDRWCDLEKVFLDSSRGCLTIPFHYEDWGQKTQSRKILFIKQYSVPVVEYLLRFCHVVQYQVHPSDGPRTWAILNTLRLKDDGRTIELQMCVGPNIDIQVNGIEIHVLSTGQRVDTTRRFTIL